MNQKLNDALAKLKRKNSAVMRLRPAIRQAMEEKSKKKSRGVGQVIERGGWQ